MMNNDDDDDDDDDVVVVDDDDDDVDDDDDDGDDDDDDGEDLFLSHAPQLIHSLLNNLFVAEKASSQLYAPLELNALMRNALSRTKNDKKLMTQPPLPPQQPPAHFL